MPNLSDNIAGEVLGDDWEVLKEITKIPDGQTVVKAWLTVKEVVDNDPSDTVVLFQKVITDAPTVSGQITDVGTGTFPDRRAEVHFFILPANTFDWEDQAKFEWDIQLKLSSGRVKTPFRGKISGIKGVTNVTT
jgi:hypothetical protein